MYGWGRAVAVPAWVGTLNPYVYEVVALLAEKEAPLKPMNITKLAQNCFCYPGGNPVS